jgi:RNA polymerase sigma-70 factor (ECF subfamily)
LPPDQELLDRYRAGDPRAMDALVDRHGASVYAFVRRTLGDTAASEDITQEVWLRVVRHAGGFDGRSRFTTWLFTVTRNACMDHLRRKQRRGGRRSAPAPDDGFAFEDLAAPGPPLLEQVAHRELTEWVEEAVGQLPDAQREVFLLREQTDLTFTEVAGLLEVPRETVKSRMRYALAQIRRYVRKRSRREVEAPHGH